MKLYKEAGVNPLGGCLPLLLQFPILIAMYAVIRAPQLQPADAAGQVVASAQATAYLVHNSHLPEDSALFKNVVLHQNLDFLGMNLQCSAAQSGTQATISDSTRNPVKPDKPHPVHGRNGAPVPATTGDGKLPCGSKTVDKIPYFALLLFMVATTFYQQRQMQQASPPGAASGQQQAILKLMPLMFGIFGFTFPAGLTLYWTTSNLWQIGQQYVLLRAGHIGPDAMERRIAENRAKSANNPEPAKLGFMARMQQRAEQSQQARSGQSPKKPPPKKPTGGQKPKPSGGSSSASGKGPQPEGSAPQHGWHAEDGQAAEHGSSEERGGGSDGAGDGEAGS